jgi:CDP-6-deoxy-D-xylo-4-hexulose-3-dehydrase
VTESTFWVGVFPGLTDPMLDYVIESFHDFVRATSGRASSGHAPA